MALIEGAVGKIGQTGKEERMPFAEKLTPRRRGREENVRQFSTPQKY